MRKAIALVLVLVLGVLTACGGQQADQMADKTPEPAPTATPVPVPPPADTTEPAKAPAEKTAEMKDDMMNDSMDKMEDKDMKSDAKAHEVSITESQYVPAVVTVAVGDLVRWTNNADVNHSAQAKDGSWDTGSIAPGASATHAFDKAGIYNYDSMTSDRMLGKVIVR